MYARHQRDGLPFRERIFSNVDLLGRIGCALPSFANTIVDLKSVRAVMEKTIGLSAKRSLPRYTSERFDRWFARHSLLGVADSGTAINDRGYNRGKVILWDDTFVRYHEPHIGIAAIKVLEALGFDVALRTNRLCCGRPAFSQGNLGKPARLGRRNLELLLRSADKETPVVYLEPSGYPM